MTCSLWSKTLLWLRIFICGDLPQIDISPEAWLPEGRQKAIHEWSLWISVNRRWVKLAKHALIHPHHTALLRGISMHYNTGDYTVHWKYLFPYGLWLDFLRCLNVSKPKTDCILKNKDTPIKPKIQLTDDEFVH